MNRKGRVIASFVFFLVGAALLGISGYKGTREQLHPSWAVSAIFVFVLAIAFAASSVEKKQLK